MTMEISPSGFFRRRRLVFFGLLAPVVLLPGAWLTMNRMEAGGREFYETGRGIVESLSKAAEALRNRDLTALERRYSPQFSGQLLGLNAVDLK